MLKEQTISRRRLSIYIITCAAVLIAVAVYMAAPRGISSLQIYAEDGSRIDTELTVYVDTDTRIRCKTEPAAFSMRSVTYSSSDEEIATVDKKGFLHAAKEGEVRITAECVGVKKYFTVVVDQSVDDISGIEEKLTMIAGEKIQLEPKLIMAEPDLEEPAISFKTKTPSVAQVDDNGIVTGIGKGIATIDVRAGTFVKSIEVTVIDPPVVYYSGYTKKPDTSSKRKTTQTDNKTGSKKKKDKNKTDNNEEDKSDSGSDGSDDTATTDDSVDPGDTGNTDTDNIDDTGSGGTDNSGDSSGTDPGGSDSSTDGSGDSSGSDIDQDSSGDTGSGSGGTEDTNAQN